MTVLLAFRDGIRRVNSALPILAGVLLLTLAVAAPLGVVLDGMIRSHLGESLAANAAADGVNYPWWQEFTAQATGVGVTFTPRILGIAPTLDAASGVVDNVPRAPVVTGAGIAYGLLWLFLVGGILARYARQRPVRTGPFFAACGVFFTRFLRLAVISAVVYGFLFGVVHGWLFGRLQGWLTHEWTEERAAFALRVALYLGFGLLLTAWNLVVDYAKIRAVVEDRRSMLGAVGAAVTFIRGHLGSAAGLYVLDGALFAAVVALYALIVPSARWGGWTAFAVTEIYLLARLWVKLVFYASQTSLFQASFAHAAYTAAPAPSWPESPAAEAIPERPAQ